MTDNFVYKIEYIIKIQMFPYSCFDIRNVSKITIILDIKINSHLSQTQTFTYDFRICCFQSLAERPTNALHHNFCIHFHLLFILLLFK